MKIIKGHNPKDVDRLYELEKLCFSRVFRWHKEDLIEALSRNNIWVGVHDDKIVGYVLVDIESTTGHIISLDVDPSYRRKGFGKSLMEEVESYYKKTLIKKLKLEVHVDNPAQLMYFNLGYRVTGFRPRYYANGSNAISMTKVIQK